MPRGKFGGTTAVRRGGLADPKADKAAGKCSSSFSGVYKGTHPSVALNSSGGQSASRSFSSRYGIQWSVTMSGASLSTAAERRANRGEALIWASVGVTSGSNPRRGPVPLGQVDSPCLTTHSLLQGAGSAPVGVQSHLRLLVSS